MDNEMIERCTLAVSDNMDLTNGLDMTAAKTYAIAVIKAMREPTEKMLCVHNEKNCVCHASYTKMIDAIISNDK